MVGLEAVVREVLLAALDGAKDALQTRAMMQGLDKEGQALAIAIEGAIEGLTDE
jgi:hypothetical protein